MLVSCFQSKMTNPRYDKTIRLDEARAAELAAQRKAQSQVVMYTPENNPREKTRQRQPSQTQQAQSNQNAPHARQQQMQQGRQNHNPRQSQHTQVSIYVADGNQANVVPREGGPRTATASQGNSHAPANYLQHPQRKNKRISGKAVGLAVGACAIIAIAFFAFTALAPVTVNVNGTDIQVGGNKTIADAVDASGAASQVQPGNFVAVDGTVLEEGKGNTYLATMNGTTVEPETALIKDAVITIENGADIEEPCAGIDEAVPRPVAVNGVGAVHLIMSQGEDGVQTTKTGNVSGRTATVITKEPVSITVNRANIDTKGEKIIALTFDDGPNTVYTPQVLDILAANNAKATFFQIGTNITDSTGKISARAASEGHQVATHSYDHAAGAGQGVNLGYMTPDEIVQEVVKGKQAIADALGVSIEQVSSAFRTPGGNFGENVIRALAPHITSEIGWNIDTNDWRKPGESVIAQRIMQAGAGDIILMHDGGGDRSQTVAALREALPALASQGYRFVTIDELLQYA